MATVYLAELRGASDRDRFCALKVPSPKYCQRDEYRQMFELEAKLALEISHPHVCRAFESGEFRQSPYLAMELLKGRSLLAIRKRIHEFEVTPRHALRVSRVIADACDGLHAIHEHGLSQSGVYCLVHHDISPDNLVLNHDGFVKILDFGLARADLQHASGMTDVLRGKISYSAPELIDRQAPSPRSDVWGLGVVAWELLVGRPLFHETTDLQTLRAIQEQRIARPSQLVRAIPESLDAIVLRALARNPAERYSSALEFGRALWRFMVSEQEVVQHTELSAWMHTLFPMDRDAFASLHETRWDGASTNQVWPPAVNFWAPLGPTRQRPTPRASENRRPRESFASYWFEAVNSRISAAAAALGHLYARPRGAPMARVAGHEEPLAVAHETRLVQRASRINGR